MKITILTLFPDFFLPVFSTSIIGRARKKKLIDINIVNIRDFATDRHKSVDDKPYGGGVGMIMRVDIVEKAVRAVRINQANIRSSGKPPVKKFLEKVILLDPKGKLFSQKIAQDFSLLDHLILVCGHYEGIDSRIYSFVDEVISVGNYVLTGGEIPSMLIADSVCRLVPGVLSKKEASANESFSSGILHEHPQYTRPPVYKGLKVPEVLLSGDHLNIKIWKEKNTKLK